MTGDDRDIRSAASVLRFDERIGSSTHRLKPGDALEAPRQRDGQSRPAAIANLRGRAMNLSQCFAAKPAPLDFVLPGLLKRGVGVLCAAGGTGKSFWALEAAMCVSSARANEQLLGLDIQQHGPVVLLNAEDDRSLMEHRIHAVGSRLTADAMEEVSSNVWVVPLVGEGVNILDQGWTAAVSKLAVGARLVILDTHSRWACGIPENDNAAQAQVVMRYEEIARASGAAVLFLHHVGKANDQDGRRGEPSAPRGASAITDNARYQAWMRSATPASIKRFGLPAHDEENVLAFGVGKVNGAARPEVQWMRRCEDGVLMPLMHSVGASKLSSRRKTADNGALPAGNRVPAAGEVPEMFLRVAAADKFGHLA